MIDYVVMDTETQNLADEIPGGWNNVYGMGMSSAVTWDSKTDNYSFWDHNSRDNLCEYLNGKTIVTYNGIMFDSRLLLGNDRTIELNGEPLSPRIGDRERECLNELEQHTPNKKIIRNNHDYVYITGRFPDGDIIGLPIFIQFNERIHYLDKEMKIENENTIRTTLDLASSGKIIFNISEYDWKEDKQKIINQFKNLVQELKELQL